MRKLIWLFIPSVALAAGGYRTLLSSRDNAGAPVETNTCPSLEECEGCCAADSCCSHGCCKAQPLSSTPDTVDEYVTVAKVDGVIELSGTDAPPPVTIQIAEAELPAPLPTDAVAPIETVAVAPVVMPYCDDDSASPATMPYAENDVWPAKTPAASSGDWFEDSEPVDLEPMPACREDEKHSLQYSGCPAPGGPASPAKAGAKKGADWRHEKEPILPVLPDVRQPAVPGDDLSPQARRSLPGLLRYTALKVFSGKGADAPARQHVDTLELRPSDLRHDEVGSDHF